MALNTVTVQITDKSGCVINMVYEERMLVPVLLFIQYSYSPEYGFSPPETNQLENVLRDYSYTVFRLSRVSICCIANLMTMKKSNPEIFCKALRRLSLNPIIILNKKSNIRIGYKISLIMIQASFILNG